MSSQYYLNMLNDWVDFTHHACVIENLLTVDRLAACECFYQVKALGTTAIFGALSMYHGQTCMIDYTNIANNSQIIKLCTEYAHNKRVIINSREDVHRQIDIQLAKCNKIPIMHDPSTFASNIEFVVKRNLAEFAKLNAIVANNILIEQINSI